MAIDPVDAVDASFRLPRLPVSRAELEALRDADFVGLPREAIVASCNWLAERCLDADEIIDSHHEDFVRIKSVVRAARNMAISHDEALKAIDRIVR